jgi:hypothetical protein
MLPGLHTTHIVCLVARLNAVPKHRSHINSARADNSPLGGTLRHGIYVTQYGVVCRPAAALSRCVLSRPPRSVGARTAPACRHPTRQPAAPLEIKSAGSAAPRPPPTPLRLAPSIPRGRRSKFILVLQSNPRKLAERPKKSRAAAKIALQRRVWRTKTIVTVQNECRTNQNQFCVARLRSR